VQSSMAALLRSRTDAGCIPGNISKIPFQKVKSLHNSMLAFFQLMVFFKSSVLNIDTMSSKAINLNVLNFINYNL